MHDLAIVLVSHYGARWVRACLASIGPHLENCVADIVVVSNADDETEEIVREFPHVRFIRCENHGFAHANNVGVRTCQARFVLFLNVDTEILRGRSPTYCPCSIDDLRWPLPACARFPRRTSCSRRSGVFRARCERSARPWAQSGSPWHPSWAGERELDLASYDEEVDCDWASGSFLLVRYEVLDEIGLMDERFFLYSEEPDLCLRAKRAGWDVRHLPAMTILHHAGKAGVNPKLEAQAAFARLQYVEKHFSSRLNRSVYRGALALRYGLRAMRRGRDGSPRREAARAAFRVVLGIDPPPFPRSSRSTPAVVSR